MGDSSVVLGKVLPGRVVVPAVDSVALKESLANGIVSLLGRR